MASRSINPFNRRSKWRSSFRGLPDSSPLLMFLRVRLGRGLSSGGASAHSLSPRGATKRRKRNGRETCQWRGIRSGTFLASNLRLRHCFSTCEDKGQRRARCVGDRGVQRRWRRLVELVESLRLPENQKSVFVQVPSQTLPRT